MVYCNITIVAGFLLYAGMCLAGDDDLSIWRNPTFRKEFLGTYATRMETEPRLTLAEQEQMEKVAPLMSSEAGMQKARALLEKNTTSGSSALFDFTIGNICMQQEQTDMAARWYRKAVEKYPAFLRAHKNMGLLYIRQGDYTNAVTSLSRAIELGAKDGTTCGLLGYSSSMIEEYTAAETAYRDAIMLQPTVLDWKLGLARCLFKQLQYESAATLCGELIDRDPGNADYWILQANAYLGMKKPLKAAENYEYLHLAGLSTAQILNTLGDVYVNENLMDLARDAYFRAIEKDKDPDPIKCLRNAEVLAARGACEDANMLLQHIQAIMKEKMNVEAKKRALKLKARLCLAQGAAEAEHTSILEEIVTLDPMDGDALILLGQQYSSQGNLEKACFYFDRAAQLEKHEADARLRHGQCLAKNGRYKEAVPLLKRAQELKNRDELAKYLEQVERLARAQE